jgi:hypothetical protein
MAAGQSDLRAARSRAREPCRSSGVVKPMQAAVAANTAPVRDRVETLVAPVAGGPEFSGGARRPARDDPPTRRSTDGRQHRREQIKRVKSEHLSLDERHPGFIQCGADPRSAFPSLDQVRAIVCQVVPAITFARWPLWRPRCRNWWRAPAIQTAEIGRHFSRTRADRITRGGFSYARVAIVASGIRQTPLVRGDCDHEQPQIHPASLYRCCFGRNGSGLLCSYNGEKL